MCRLKVGFKGKNELNKLSLKWVNPNPDLNGHDYPLNLTEELTNLMEKGTLTRFEILEGLKPNGKF